MNHPFHYLINQELAGFKESVGGAAISVLYCASIEKKAGCNPKTSTIIKTLSHVGEPTSTEEFCNKICSFFTFLHPYIITPSITPFGKVPTLMP